MNHNFVISMVTAKKRREHIAQQFNAQNISFQFFDACTPSQELSDYLQENLPNLLKTNNLSMGEKGCLTSHFMLWKKCVDENLDYIAIFEDDILLGKDANYYLERWDWLQERFNSDASFVLRLETFLIPVDIQPSIIPSFMDRKIDTLRSVHFGTAGYILSRRAADYLIKRVLGYAEDEFIAADDFMFGRLVKELDYTVYQLNPAICVQELQFNHNNSVLSSDLEEERHLVRKSRKTKKTLKQRLIKIKANLLKAFSKERYYRKKKEASYKVVPFL